MCSKQDQDALNTYILSNRGSFAFISLVGDLHAFEAAQGSVMLQSTAEQRIEVIGKYLLVLFKALMSMKPEDAEVLAGKLGSGAEATWLRYFQSYINAKFPDYDPSELQDWRERQDKALQTEGRELGTQIERHMKNFIIAQLKALFDDNWDIEIGTIQRDCEVRAKEQIEKDYKDGLGRHEIFGPISFSSRTIRRSSRNIGRGRPRMSRARCRSSNIFRSTSGMASTARRQDQMDFAFQYIAQQLGA